MEGKATALVTGGSRRIGAAIVRDLAAHGFAVAIHCNTTCSEAGGLAAEITAAGGKVTVLQADFEDEAAVKRLVPDAAAALGPVQLLVNNASVFEDDSVTDFNVETWDLHFRTHLLVPSLLARDMAAALPAGREGLIVNMIDQRVWALTPRFYSYTLSKSALWTATRTMAQTLAPSIRVNAIGPGPTLPNERQDQADFDRQVDGLLLKRGPELDEFGSAIRFLWEARSVTGQMIALDGGQHLGWETPDITGIRE